MFLLGVTEAYTTHESWLVRIDLTVLARVPSEPGHGSEVRALIGDPLDPVLVGPSSAARSRTAAPCSVLFATTDGGTTAPPDDGRRPSSGWSRLPGPGRLRPGPRPDAPAPR